jgi:DNA-binding Xre family transcriptional regulator
MRDTHIGSTFESFLEERGLENEVDLLAQKRVIAWQIEQAMAEEKVTKAELAARMKTSRTQVDRLLDPQNNRVQLDTLQRAALAVGRSLKVELAKRAHAVHVQRAVKRANVRRGSKAAARTSPMRSSRPKAKTRKTVGK